MGFAIGIDLGTTKSLDFDKVLERLYHVHNKCGESIDIKEGEKYGKRYSESKCPQRTWRSNNK